MGASVAGDIGPLMRSRYAWRSELKRPGRRGPAEDPRVAAVWVVMCEWDESSAPTVDSVWTTKALAVEHIETSRPQPPTRFPRFGLLETALDHAGRV